MDPPGPDDGVARIHDLLRAKDDTQRFVGLALLKSMFDNAPRLRQDAQAVQQLWASLSPRFLDRLLRTGSNPSNKNAREMLDLAVSVLHTFAALLPAQSTAEPRLTDRIPGLVDALLHRCDRPPGPPSSRAGQLTLPGQLRRHDRPYPAAPSHPGRLARRRPRPRWRPRPEPAH